MSKVLIVDAKEVEKLRAVVGTEGSTLNPIQDKAGNWFISYEELNAPQFNKFFQIDERVTITEKLIETDYIPKDAEEFPTREETTKDI